MLLYTLPPRSTSNPLNFTFFYILNFYYIYLFCEVTTLWSSQRAKAKGSCFSPSNTWSLSVQLRLGSRRLYWPAHLTGLDFFTF